MLTSLGRVGLVLSATALVLSSGHGQPPAKSTPPIRPHYTAFPDLKHPRAVEEVRGPDGKSVKVEKVKPVPLPPVPELGDNPTALRRVHFELVQNGLEYLERIAAKRAAGDIGPRDEDSNAQVAAETLHAIAALEPTAKKRLPWYEARVRELKEWEGFVRARVEVGVEAPQALNRARVVRLRAEADLLELLAEIEKAK